MRLFEELRRLRQLISVTGLCMAVEPSTICVYSLGIEHPLTRVKSRQRASDLTLEGLFREHAPDVHRIVARLLGPGASSADIEDLVQQVFIAVHGALPRFRGDSKATTWLYGITTRTVLTHLRGRRRHRRMVEALESMAQVLPPKNVDMETEVAHRQSLQTVWRALMQIKAKKRVVYVLYEVEGLSGKEIAAALQIKEATVHTRLYHARRELDAALLSQGWHQ